MGFGQQGRHNDFTLQTALSFCFLQSWRDGLLDIAVIFLLARTWS
jgi:hypothetical protein